MSCSVVDELQCCRRILAFQCQTSVVDEFQCSSAPVLQMSSNVLVLQMFQFSSVLNEFQKLVNMRNESQAGVYSLLSCNQCQHLSLQMNSSHVGLVFLADKPTSTISAGDGELRARGKYDAGKESAASTQRALLTRLLLLLLRPPLGLPHAAEGHKEGQRTVGVRLYRLPVVQSLLQRCCCWFGPPVLFFL